MGCQRIPAKPVLAPVVARERTVPSAEQLHGRDGRATACRDGRRLTANFQGPKGEASPGPGGKHPGRGGRGRVPGSWGAAYGFAVPALKGPACGVACIGTGAGSGTPPCQHRLETERSQRCNPSRHPAFTVPARHPEPSGPHRPDARATGSPGRWTPPPPSPQTRPDSAGPAPAQSSSAPHAVPAAP